MWAVLAGVSAVLVVALVGAAVVLLDRYAAATAERRAADALAAPVGRSASVRLDGRPFLTQALRGVYSRVSVQAGGLRIGEMTGATLTAELRNVHLPLRDLLRRRATELPVETVSGTVVLPYGELARVARVPGLELRERRGRVVATATLPVPGLGQLARVTGRAVLGLEAGNQVWLHVRGISVAGISVPTVVLNQLLPSLDVPIPLPPLPFGLRLDALEPGDDGLVVHGSAEAVVLRALATPADRPLPTTRDARPGT